MDNRFMSIALVVMLSLMVFGILMLPILKKFKAKEGVVTATVIFTCFCGLVSAGALVYIVSINMMKDYVEIKRYHTYNFENSDGSRVLTVKEYSDDKVSGIELYLDDEEKKLADLRTDRYLPFGSGEYKVEWSDNSVKVFYTFRNTEEQYICRSCTIGFDGKIENNDNEKIDLRKKDEPQMSFDISPM